MRQYILVLLLIFSQVINAQSFKTDSSIIADLSVDIELTTLFSPVDEMYTIEYYELDQKNTLKQFGNIRFTNLSQNMIKTKVLLPSFVYGRTFYKWSSKDVVVNDSITNTFFTIETCTKKGISKTNTATNDTLTSKNDLILPNNINKLDTYTETILTNTGEGWVKKEYWSNGVLDHVTKIFYENGRWIKSEYWKNDVLIAYYLKKPIISNR